MGMGGRLSVSDVFGTIRIADFALSELLFHDHSSSAAAPSWAAASSLCLRSLRRVRVDLQQTSCKKGPTERGCD